MRIAALFVVYYTSAGYALFNPLFGVLFFIHIMALRPENLVWEQPIFGRLHLVTALCIALGYLIRRDRVAPWAKHQRRNGVLFTALVGWFWLVTVATAWSFEASVVKAFDLTKILFFCVLASLTLTSTSRIRLYVLVSSGSFGLLGLWGALQGMAGNWRLDNVWIAGSNELAAVLALMIPFTLTATFDGGFPRWQRLGLALSVLTMTICLTYTASRGGFLALLAGLVALIVLAKQRAKLLVGLVALVAAVYPMIPAQYESLVSSVVQDGADADLSAASRPVLWRLAIRIWRDHPFVGVGPGNFPLVVDSYADQATDIVTSEAMAKQVFGRGRFPHGLYTGVLAEAGAPALGLFLTLLLRNVLCRLDRHGGDLALVGKGAQAGIVGFAIAAVFGDFQYVDVIYWQLFLVGSILACAEVRTDGPTAPGAREPRGRLLTGETPSGLP